MHEGKSFTFLTFTYFYCPGIVKSSGWSSFLTYLRDGSTISMKPMRQKVNEQGERLSLTGQVTKDANVDFTHHPDTGGIVRLIENLNEELLRLKV